MTRYRMTPLNGQWRLYAMKPAHSAQGAAQLALCTCGNPHTLRRVLRALQRLEARNG